MRDTWSDSPEVRAAFKPPRIIIIVFVTEPPAPPGQVTFSGILQSPVSDDDGTWRTRRSHVPPGGDFRGRDAADGLLAER